MEDSKLEVPIMWHIPEGKGRIRERLQERVEKDVMVVSQGLQNIFLEGRE